jgi:ankyrin repeat protein
MSMSRNSFLYLSLLVPTFLLGVWIGELPPVDDPSPAIPPVLSLESQDSSQASALMTAALDAQLHRASGLIGTTREDLQKLIESGADVDSRRDGTPLLISAIGSQSPEILLFLLEQGAELEARDQFGNAVLSIAASSHRGPATEQVRVLLDAGAQIEAQDHQGNAALMSTMFHSSLIETVHLLLEKGANLETRNNKGWTPLMCATASLCQHDLTKLKYLLEHGAQMEVVGHAGETPLMLAAQGNNFEMFEYLLEKGADPEVRCSRGSTLLMYAAQNPWTPEMVQLLIDRGADLDATNDQGWTALMFAANTDSHEPGTAWSNPITPDIIVQRLLDQGANAKIANNEGKKAVQYAFQNLQIDGKWTFRNLYDVSDWSP